MAAESTRFGYTSQQWQSAVQAGVEALVDTAARRDQTITYTDLCNRIRAHTGVEIIPGEYALPYLLGDELQISWHGLVTPFGARRHVPRTCMNEGQRESARSLNRSCASAVDNPKRS